VLIKNIFLFTHDESFTFIVKRDNSSYRLKRTDIICLEIL